MSTRTTRPPVAGTLLRAARWTATPAGLATLFAAGFLLRLLLARGGGFPGDIAIFQDWARRLADVGPRDFYAPGYFADYPPGYLYVLWPFGELARVMFDGIVPVFLVKLPAMVADVGIAYVVMRLATIVAAAGGVERWWVRPAAAAAILFNPPIVFLSAVWGQVDSVAAFYALAGILVLVRKAPSARSEAGGAALFALAFATKPQTAFLLPVVALVLIVRHVRGKEIDVADLVVRLGIPLIAFVATWAALGIPFGLGPAGLLEFYSKAGSTYPVTSVWAFNFWGIAGFWRPDSGADAFHVFGISAIALAVVVFSAGATYVLIRMFRALAKGRSEVEVILGGGAAVVCLSFALLTRIHERYLFLGLACLAPLIVYPRVRAAFAALALLYMVNIYFPWVYYIELEGRETLQIDWLVDLVYGTATDTPQKKLLGLATGALCVAVAVRIWDLLKPSSRPAPPVREEPATRVRGPAGGPWKLGLHPIGRRGAAFAGIVFLVVAPTRLIGLSSPQEMYFDEIYHARTAGEYLEGKNAYEFTHPPLGKELMALSTAAFSDWGAADAGPSPTWLDSAISDSDGTTVVWATRAPGEGGAVYYSAPLPGGCVLDEEAEATFIDVEPRAIAVAPAGGAFIAGSSGRRESVVARYAGESKTWEAAIDAPVSDLAAAGEVVFAVDEDGTLWRADAAGATALADGAAAVAPDADLTGVWVAFPANKIVAAYDSAGTEVARPSTYGAPDEVTVIADADRVLAFDTGAGLIEGIDNQSKTWVDQLETDAERIVPGPGKGLAYAVEGRGVEVLEPRGLSVIGETTLPAEPASLVPVRNESALLAAADNRLSCVTGDNTFAWRLPGALLGALVPALVFLLALRCTGSVIVAALAAAFMALDGLGYAMSRIATLDSQVTAWIAASWLAALSAFFHAHRARDGDRSARRAGLLWIVATGILLGLAIATKWVGVYSFLAIALLIAVDLLARGNRGIGALFPNPGAGAVIILTAAFALPVGIYVLSYVPYFALDHSFGDLLRLQKGMYEYHAGLTEGHPFSSPWYGWPVGFKAVALWAGQSGFETGAITAIANPVVLIGGLWGLAVAGLSAWRHRVLAPAAIVVAALVQYLPWVIVSRAAFLYHYLPVVPFLAIGLAWALVGRGGRARLRLYEVAFVLGAAVAVFAVTFPELDGWYTSPEFHQRLHGWFPWMF